MVRAALALFGLVFFIMAKGHDLSIPLALERIVFIAAGMFITGTFLALAANYRGMAEEESRHSGVSRTMKPEVVLGQIRVRSTYDLSGSEWPCLVAAYSDTGSCGPTLRRSGEEFGMPRWPLQL